MPSTKICKGCGLEKTLDLFGKNTTYADGHDGKCKKCRATYHKEYVKKNADKKKEYRKKYYQKNKELIHAKQKQYYEKNREIILSKAARYRDAHREEINQYFRARYRANRRQLLDSRKDYNEAHREERRIYLKEYYRKNKEHLTKQNYKTQRERIKREPIYKLKRQVGLLIWRSFNQRGYVKPARSEKILGCKLESFTSYLKQTWLDKYGTEWVGQPCHIDHIIPLATAKTEADVIKLCHYTNLRLLTPKDNMEKSDSLDYAILNKLIKEGERK